MFVPPPVLLQVQKSLAEFPEFPAWDRAVRTNEWAEVARLGEPILGKPAPFGMDKAAWDRIQGFTRFALYFMARERRSPRDPLTEIREAATLIPDQDEVWYELGAELNRQGRNEEAMVPLKEYLNRKPGSFDAEYELAYALNALNRCKESLPILQLLQRDHSSEPIVANELGFALNHLGRPTEALSVLEEGLRKKPTMSGWAEKSISLRMLERWDQAELALDAAVRLGFDPKFAAVQRQQIRSREKVAFEVFTSDALIKKAP